MNFGKTVGLTVFAVLLLGSLAPFASADWRYDMTTYIQGYLDVSVPDDRVDSWTQYGSILGAGRNITPALAPKVVFSGVVGGNASNYTEVENIFAYAMSTYDTTSRQVKAKLTRAADVVSFTPAIQASNGVGTQIYFLGNYWTISSMNGFTSSGCASNCSVVLSRGSFTLTLTQYEPLPGAMPWTVTLVAEGAALKKIELKDITSVPSLAAGQYLTIAKPAGGVLHSHNLVFDGIESVSRDTLAIQAMSPMYLPLHASDSTTRGNVVMIRSNLSNPFGNALNVSDPVNAIYFVVGNAAGNATVGDIFYYYQGYFRRFVHPQGGGGINFVDYAYAPGKSVQFSFNANNAEQYGDPNFVNFVIGIPEYVDDNEMQKGGWFIDVGGASNDTRLFVNTTYDGFGWFCYSPTNYSVAQPVSCTNFASGLVSWRGSIGTISDYYNGAISYALSLSHAKYSLVKLAGSPPIPDSCTDTDGGLNYFVRGTVSGYFNNVTYTYVDACTSNTTLREYYCNGTLSNSVYYSCSYGCVNGACLRSPIKPTTAVTDKANMPPQTKETNFAAAPPEGGAGNSWLTVALVLVLFAAIVSTGYFWRARSMKK